MLRTCLVESMLAIRGLHLLHVQVVDVVDDLQVPGGLTGGPDHYHDQTLFESRNHRGKK